MRVLVVGLLAYLVACGAANPAPALERPPATPLRPALETARLDGFDALRVVLANAGVKAMLDGEWQLATGSVLVTAAVSVSSEADELPDPNMRPGDFIVGLGAGLEGESPLFLVFAGVDPGSGKARVLEILRRRNATLLAPTYDDKLMRAGEAIHRALAADATLHDLLSELKRNGRTATDVPGLRWGLRYRAKLDKEPPTGTVTILMAKPREGDSRLGGGGGPSAGQDAPRLLEVSEVGHADLDLGTRELLPAAASGSASQ